MSARPGPAHEPGQGLAADGVPQAAFATEPHSAARFG